MSQRIIRFRYTHRAHLSVADVDCFECFDDSFDETTLKALFDEHWRWNSPLGEPGEQLFHYFGEMSDHSAIQLKKMQLRTIEILNHIRDRLKPTQVPDVFAFFASVHRFWARLATHPELPYQEFISELRPFLVAVFEFVVAITRDSVIPHFKTWFASPTFRFLLLPVSDIKQLFGERIGKFVWKRVLNVVDCELANLFMDPTKLLQKDDLIAIRERLDEVQMELKLKIPLFAEALSFILDYQRMDAESIPFEEVVSKLPAGFVLGIMFACKRKGLIPLEINDRRILAFGESRGADFATIDEQMVGSDTDSVEIPASLWEF
jgi:hypothetical protein